MEEPPSPAIRAGSSIREGFSALLRPPFRGIALLSLLIALVLESLPEEGDNATLFAALLLLAMSLYLQISLTLAAAETNPAGSVDVWLKQAFARRCFWRYVAISLLVVLSVVAAGVIGLVIGGFLVGGILALADQAVVLEGKRPLEAVARSAELGKPARTALIVVFGMLVLIPGLSVQVGSIVWDLNAFFGDIWPLIPVVVMVLGLVGTIALTRAFITLGGEVVRTQPRRVPPPP